MNLRRFRKAETFNEFITWCLIVAFVVGQLTLPPAAQAGAPGTSTVSAGTAPPPAATTTESFQPDLFTGRAGTSIAIGVPPGRKTLEPHLAAGYSSASQNGLLGVGWGFDLGFIERSTKKGVPKYDGSDVFAFQLGGGSSEMVKLDSGTYRAEDEGLFLKLEDLGANGWRVTDKSGTQYFLGRTGASRMENGGKVFRWCLDRVIDPNGNTMDYSYMTHGGQPYPSQIDYTGHTNGLAPACRVTFTWEDRPDVTRSLRSGWEVQTAKRLAKVETFATVSNALSMAARYVFGYGVSARTGRSLLTSFQKFGTDGVTALPAMTFTYQSDVAPTYAYSFSPGNASTPAWNVSQANLEGDNNYGCVHPYVGLPWSSPVVASGWTDLTGSKYLNVTSGGGFEMQGTEDWYLHAWTYVYSPTSSVRSFSSANHATEGCLWVEDSKGVHGPYHFGSLYNIPFEAGWAILHVTGYNLNEGPWSLNLYNNLVSEFSRMAPAASSQPQLTGDVDGNGITDLIQYKDGNWTVSRATSSTIEPPGSPWLSGFGSSSDAPMLGDWNADGRVDMGLFSGGTWKFARSTGSNFVANVLPAYSFGSGTPFSGDFNGDGITDLGSYSTGTWRVALGSGTGFAEAASFKITQPSDYLIPSNKVMWDVRWWSRNMGPGDPCIVSDPPDTALQTNICSTGSIIEIFNSRPNTGFFIPATASIVYAVSPGGGIKYSSSYNMHLRTHAFNASNRTVSLIQTGGWGWSRACLWVEDTNGLHQLGDDWTKPVLTNTVTLPAGWSTFHIMACVGYTMSISDLLPQVDAINVDKPAEQKDINQHVTGDFNGDGLTDIGVIRKGNLLYPAFSDGTTFIPQPAWPIAFGSNEYVTADFNGDGMTDVAYFDRTTGRIKVGTSTGSGLRAPVDLGLAFSLRTRDDAIQLGEFNGDGLPDLAIFNPIGGDAEMGKSAGTTADLLVGIQNGLGASSAIKYRATTTLSNTYLPMAMQVVIEASNADGMGNTNTTAYTYANGLYDTVTREFRGFGHVEVKDFDNNVVATDFHQDYERKGRAYRTTVTDASGNLWTKEEKVYSASVPYPGKPSFFTHMDQSDTYTYDGNASFKQTRIRHTYDAYGNMTASYLDGDVTVTGDEKATVTTFNLNPAAWILNTASLVQTLDAASNVVAQARTYYDGATDLAALPTRGSITREEQWLNLPAPQWIGTSVQHDPYGNPLVSSDQLGRAVTNVYDATFTYLTSTKSPLGHQRVQMYDPRFGQVTSVIDQNKVRGETYFDALGRKVGEAIVDPGSGQRIVQSEAEYRMSVPTRIKTTVYAQPGKGGAMTSFVFMDGLGRKIQSREPSETPGRQNISGAAQYDPKGRMTRQWTAYEDAYSEEYVSHTTVAGLAPAEEYEYDPLGRIIWRQTSNGAIMQTVYEDWTTTYTDANGHVRRVFSDAYGRVVRVEEVNGGETYISTYGYDIQGNLMLATDHFGNQVHATYDSLGRKISSDDPNLGLWTYAYNARGQLTRQVDARGTAIEFTLDAMDRLVRKHYVPGPGIDAMADAVYTYDGAGIAFATGRLTRVDDASGSLTFAYDFMNRAVGETRSIDGTNFTSQTSLDLLGRMTRFTYPNGHRVDYTYNAAGGIETVTLTAGTTTHPIVTDITYNAAGLMTRIAYGNGVVSDFTYNPKTLKLSHKRTLGPDGSTRLQDLDYVRDPVGNILQITDTVNTGTQVFQYDDLNRLIRAEGVSYGVQNFAYDAIGNMLNKAGVTMSYGAGPAGPHAVTATSSGLALTYDVNGNMTGRVSAATGVLAMRYDAENRLAEVRSTSTGPATVSLAPGMNLVGFPSLGSATTVTNALKQFGTAYAQVTRMRPQDQKFESFVGNASFNQFTNVTPGEGYWVYCTNAAGATMNLPSVAGTPATRTLTNGWHILAGPARAMSVASWLAPLVAGTDYGQVKAYDTATATLVPARDVVPGRAYCVQVLRSCAWKPMAAGQVETTRFTYDADGARVKKTTDAGTAYFLGSSYEVQGSSTIEYVFSGKDRVASLTSAGELRFYLTDHLNSANLVVDGGGQVKELVEYAPYGQLSKRTGAADTPFKYTGQRLDGEVGLYFYGARYYDPELGRFISADTVVQDPGDPQSWNRYSYARNNPILFTDPSGNVFILDDFVMAIVIGAIIGAVVGATMAYMNGGDIAQGALMGAVTGAISGGFNYLANAAFAGTGAMDYFGRAAINAAGSAASGGAGAAIRGEPIGKAMLKGFVQSAVMSAGNYIVGQWSGYAKQGEMKVFKNTGIKPDSMKDIGVNGINTSKTSMLLDAKKFDEFIYNPSHGWGGLADVVECAQELFFGPSSFSRELGSYMSSMNGQMVSIVAHSQGTIMTTRALQVMGNNGAKFAPGSTVTFNNPPIDPVQAYSAGWKVGLQVAYRPDPRDLVSAIGSPWFVPTAALPTAAGDLGRWHCAYSFENAFPHQ